MLLIMTPWTWTTSDQAYFQFSTIPLQRPAPAVTGDVMVNQERRGESSHSTHPVTAEAGVQDYHFTSYFVFPHQFYFHLPSF